MIVQKHGMFYLYSKDGEKLLGKFDTEKEAVDRERQINFFKHRDKSQ